MNRETRIHAYGNGPTASGFEALVSLYAALGSEIRTLGLPPIEASRLREWLADVVGDYSPVAWHRDDPIGHSALVGEQDRRGELAIFVEDAYQCAGIGSRPVETPFAVGRRGGTERWSFSSTR